MISSFPLLLSLVLSYIKSFEVWKVILTRNWIMKDRVDSRYASFMIAFLFLSRLAWSSVYPVQDRKSCIGWMPGHWEGRTLSKAKGHGEIPSVIHGSPIGKPYPSSVASLRSLDFENLANWNIWVAKGREINRDPVSSGERERIGGLKKNKHDFVPQQSVHFFFARFHSICCGLDDGKPKQAPWYSISQGRSEL